MKRNSRTGKGLVNTEELGRAVRRRREELGLSLRDVASKTSVSASTLSRIENGTGKPDADNIARLTAWLDVPMERVFVNLDRYGNTSAATIPIALVEAAEQGRLRDGDNVLLTAFGGGLTWASAVIRWGHP